MQVLVKVIELKPTEFTYCVNGVNSLDEAKQAAWECYNTHVQSDECYLYRTIPRKLIANVEQVEVTKV